MACATIRRESANLTCSVVRRSLPIRAMGMDMAFSVMTHHVLWNRNTRVPVQYLLWCTCTSTCTCMLVTIYSGFYLRGRGGMLEQLVY